MIKRIISILLILAICYVLGFNWWRSRQNILVTQLLALPDRSLAEIQVGAVPYQVEVVHQPASITQGLSGRTTIGSDGMLFVLPVTTVQTFWMPEMKFDLDMLWFADGQLTEITAQVPAPAPETPRAQLPHYPSKRPVNLVLELAAGRAASDNLQVGDQLTIID